MKGFEVPGGLGWEPRVDLGGGVVMPLIGCGTQFGFAEDGNHRGSVEGAADYVALALRTGFRLLDTARGYTTEANVMRGIDASGVDRRAVFVVSKAWPGSDHAPGRESSRAAIAASAARLGGYVDLFLVHQPVVGWQDLWRALEDAKDAGLVRAIGVSNFAAVHLEELRGFARHRPAVNQIHLHPFVYRQHVEVLRLCAQHGIRVMAFPRSPWRLGEGTAIDGIAADVGRTRAQVMLRWAVEHGFAVIPLSTNSRHLADNLAVAGFSLTPEQVQQIDAIGDVAPLHYHVDAVSGELVAGWAFSPGGLARIDVLVDGEPVGQATRGLPRPDVGQAHAGAVAASASGFVFRFPAGGPLSGRRTVGLRFVLADGQQIESVSATVSIP